MNKYTKILEEELVVALGCTEPIAIAYAAAKAVDVLGVFPNKIVVACSGNIIKNVKGVIVPGTGDMKGIDTSAILGAIVGKPSLQLEILNNVCAADIKQLQALLATDICEVELVEDVCALYIEVKMYANELSSSVEIIESHNNITRIKKNGELIYVKPDLDKVVDNVVSRDFLTIAGIYDYVNTVDIADLKSLLSKQVEYNSAIANEGLINSYGANVGKTIKKYSYESLETTAKALASSGSDARMGGCLLPVVINAGSGNQGITVSVPVVTFAKGLNKSEEAMYRALALSNLVSVYIKSGIGKLSAFCGAVSAACGSGAAIAYLYDESQEIINNTIINCLANSGGIVCDGAKASCAAKISTALDSAFVGYKMAKDNNVFPEDSGLVGKTIDETIQNFIRVAKLGMKATDVEILKIMIGK